MSEITRNNLFGKLNSIGYRAMEAATVFARMRGNPDVELAHWIHQMLQLQDSDLHRIIRQFDLNESRLARDLTDTLDTLPGGSTVLTDISPQLEEAIERGWVYGTLMFGDSQVRCGHLMIGILKTRNLARTLLAISGEFAKIRPEALTEHFTELVGDSPESGLGASDGSRLGKPAGTDAVGGAGRISAGDLTPAPMGREQALQQFTVDLTEEARSGRMDPIAGRDDEIRQIIDILMRRRQNNPILTGEAGVGKTAVVEGFAQRIVAGEVPPALQQVVLRTLDMGLLQAGASIKGEFEQRLRQVIDEVQASERPVILFIDEAHTLVGAGGQAGSGDAANLMKPALARGTLRTIAATTWSEYKRYFERDPALARRFQVIQVREPSEPLAILMMRRVATRMEQHHRVQILDQAIEAAVRLSHRYIPSRQLPDKAVGLLDTSCARVAISQHSVPADVDDARKRIEALDVELARIRREREIGIESGRRARETRALRHEELVRMKTLESRWQQEKALVDEILELRGTLRGEHGAVDSFAGDQETESNESNESGGTPEPAAIEDTRQETAIPFAERRKGLTRLRDLQRQLETMQGDAPLILPSVDELAVGTVVQDWTGIPVGRMVRNETETVLHLADRLEQRIIGQRHALEMVARRIQTSRAGLDDPGKPIGVFLFAGSSGVGKTETALALAETLYGGEQNVITINMSEFQEAHTVSTLKGAPPGYVGYGEGGVLTEAVRRRPYSVLLLDEIEKAHPDVHELFFQVFDKGWMEDGEGRVIDFRNTLILLTTNVGTDLIVGMCSDPALMPQPDALAGALRTPLLKVFPAALLGRLVVVPFLPLDDAVIRAIAELQLGRIARRIGEQHGIDFRYDETVTALITARCTELESGGRMINAILTNTVLPTISAELLQRTLDGRAVHAIEIGADDGAFNYRYQTLPDASAASRRVAVHGGDES